MNKSLYMTVSLTIAVGMALSALPSHGGERQLWTNKRVQTELHPSFEILNGPSQGKRIVVELADGSVYHQSYMNPHLDKIQWDEAFWYVCDGVVVWAPSDEEALTHCLDKDDIR